MTIQDELKKLRTSLKTNRQTKTPELKRLYAIMESYSMNTANRQLTSLMREMADSVFEFSEVIEDKIENILEKYPE